MFNLNGKNLCEYCFSEVSTNACPKCKYISGRQSTDAALLRIGTILENRYRIGGLLGKGGFGITYLAYDMKLAYKVAIKEYYPFGMATRTVDTPFVTVTGQEAVNTFRDGVRRFYDEAKLVAQFNGNPNIVNVSDFFYANNTAYFVMSYVKGQTLKSYLNENGPLSLEQAVRIISDVANALTVAHNMKVLHRDISPDNIMLCTDGTVKLLDFGAAREVTAMRQNMSVVLKQGFAPLEQYQKNGDQGPWTDAYSLGATIYYSMTGKMLLDPMSRMEDDSAFLENAGNIPEDFFAILKKCLELEPKNRYYGMARLKEDLQKIKVGSAAFHVHETNLSDYTSAQNMSHYQTSMKPTGMPNTQTGPIGAPNMQTGPIGAPNMQTGPIGMPNMQTGYTGASNMRTGRTGIPNENRQATKKKGKGLWIGLSASAAGVVMLLLLGVVFVFSGSGGEDANYLEYTNDTAQYSVLYNSSYDKDVKDADTVIFSNKNGFVVTIDYLYDFNGNGFIYSADDFAQVVAVNENKLYDLLGTVTLINTSTVDTAKGKAYVYNYTKDQTSSVLYVFDGKGDFGCYTMNFQMPAKDMEMEKYQDVIDKMINSFEVSDAYQNENYELVDLDSCDAKIILNENIGNISDYQNNFCIYPVANVFMEGNIWITKMSNLYYDSIEEEMKLDIDSWIAIAGDGKITSEVKELEYGRYPVYGMSYQLIENGVTKYGWICILETENSYWKLEAQSTDEYEDKIIECCDDVLNSLVDNECPYGIEKE